MSKKNKMFRAWIHNYPHNYPEGGERSAFEFGWRNGKKERDRLAAENQRLREAVEDAAEGFEGAAEGHGIDFYAYASDMRAALLQEKGDEHQY